MSQIKDYLTHYRKKIERGVDEEKKLYILRKLQNVPVTKEILQETGIAKTVKQLTKEGGQVGEQGTILIKLWKHCIYKNASSDKHSEKGVKRTQSMLSNGQNVNIKYEQAVKKRKYDVGYLEQEHGYMLPDSTCPEYTANSDTESVDGKSSALNHQEFQESGKNPLKYVPTIKHPSVVTYSEAYDPEKPEICMPQAYNPTPIPIIKSFTNSNRYYAPNAQLQEDAPYSSHNHGDKKTKDINLKSEKLERKDLKLKKHAGEAKLKESNDDISLKSHRLANHEKQKMKSESTRKHKNHLKDNVSHQKNHKSDTPKHLDVVKKVSKSSSGKHSENDKVKNGFVVKSTKKKIKVPEAEVFTSSEVTFEDCLGLNDIMSRKKKKSTKIVKAKQPTAEQTSPSNEKTSKVKDSKTKLSLDQAKSKSPVPDVSKPKSSTGKVKSKSSSTHDKIKSTNSSKISKDKINKLPKELQVKPNPIQIDEGEFLITLPEINANYRPLPRFDLDSSFHSKKALSNEEAIMFTSSKKDRTAVYSGRKNNFLTEVPTLFETCTRVLIDNISCIEYTGGVPYFVIKPVLERSTPQILYRLEDFNPYLLDDTHELWQQHCTRDFRNYMPEEGETWRDMYIRIIDERERKLEKLTSNIKGSISNSNPARRAKLAYIDSFVKPPRDVARQQAKFGTGHAVNHTVKPPSPPKAVAKSASPVISEKSNFSSTSKKPPKRAPLMAKTLKAMKHVYRR